MIYLYVMAQKVPTNITLDRVIKRKAQKIIKEKLNSNLSKEIEIFLRELVDQYGKR